MHREEKKEEIWKKVSGRPVIANGEKKVSKVIESFKRSFSEKREAVREGREDP